MNHEEFIEFAKRTIYDSVKEDWKKNNIGEMPDFKIYTVWSCKTLQNGKAIMALSIPGDHRIYEVTHNGDEDCMYVDTYNKLSNKKVRLPKKTQEEEAWAKFMDGINTI